MGKHSRKCSRQPVGGTSAKAARRFIVAGTAVTILVLLGGASLTFWTRAPRAPEITAAGLDPAVAKLIESALAGVRAAPRSGPAWGKLGSALMHYEFIEESARAFDRAEKLSPNDARWPYLCALLFLPREAETAMMKLRRVIAISERADAPRLRLAQLLAERGHSREAEQHFQTLLLLTPNHAPALLGLARLRYNQGLLAESTNFLSGCLQDPHTAKSACVLLATIYQALGHTSAAAAATRESAELPPDTPWPDPYWREALTYRVGRKALLEDASALMEQRRFAEAVQILAAIARDYPDDDESWYQMGWAFNQQQQSAEAEGVLREHLRRSPQSPKGHAQLAVALLAQRRFEEAASVLGAALKLKPTWRELHFNLGYACVQLDRRDEAILHFRAALACDPNHPATYLALAELLIRRGDQDEAQRLLHQALQLDPPNARARALLQRLAPN